MPLTSGTSASCAHCGQPAPHGIAPVFCCSGCETVFAALSQCGLGDFYRLRTEFASTTAAPTAARRNGDDYDALDDTEALRERGFAPGDVLLRIAGLHCAACVWVLERLPRALPGVLEARVDLGANTLRLRWDPGQIQLSRIARFVHDLGYVPRLGAAEVQAAAQTRSRRELWRLGVTGALAGNAMMAAFALYAGELSTMEPGFVQMFKWLGLAFALPAVTWGAWPFYRGALAGLRVRTFHMDLPIALGLVTGFAASAWATVTGDSHIYFDTITILVFLLLVGRRLQSWGQQQARTQAELLGNLLPSMVERRVGAGWQSVRSRELAIGDVIRVGGDERFGADGEIRTGSTHVDVAILTGESAPEPVASGSQVLAGSTNLGDTVEVVVTRVGGDTRVGTILARACSADARPAAIVRFADRVAGWFVAVVLALAAAAGAWWWSYAPHRAFDVVVSLLVISCPCALGLATPMALAIARGRAARRNLVVRSTATLETLGRVGTVIFDKTGTLTEGRLRVVEAELPGELRPLLAAIERRSRHPIARAISAWACDAGSDLLIPTAFEEIPGSGVVAEIAGHRIRVGSTSWIPTEHPMADRAAVRAHTPIVVESDGSVVGVIAVADRVRPEAAAMVARLRDLGKTIMIASGDHPRVVAAVAEQLKIAHAFGGCSPERKAKLVIEHGPAALIGDGINDALAMRAAAASIAVRGGAEAALAVADVYLADESLEAVTELFGGARATNAVILRGLGFSLAYNLLFATLAVADHVTPLVAAVLMPLSSLCVVANSLWSTTFSRAHGAHASQPHSLDAPRFSLSEGFSDPMPQPQPRSAAQ